VNFRHWFLEGLQTPTPADLAKVQHKAAWWQVMCLTGVDYFSTLGYQPSIAFVAAQFLSPFATIVVVLLTLFGALPIYSRIAALSPNGQGSLSILEERLPRWRGKAFVLVLLGFAATGWVITITLSAADAAVHIVNNPLAPQWINHPLAITLLLLAALAGIFLKGFKEAIWLAIGMVAVYLTLNAVLVGGELWALFHHPEWISAWRANLFAQQSNPLMIVLMAFILFPKLALGLSGFETGVAVMPLVRGVDGPNVNPADDLKARIVNTRKLLKTAAIIMSVLLIGSSFVTATMIPAGALMEGGAANGRALAYLAHRDFGEVFGTAYDTSTIAILWFAGASAMAGLLNLVPRYLPRYGMAPDWARATRPLVTLITGISVLVTVLFNADVDAQGGAYATGVLALMTSACVAVVVALPKQRKWFLPIALVFIYTTILNIYESPEGIKIASWFIVSIVIASLVSRVMRSTEIRIHGVDYDELAERFVHDAAVEGRMASSRRNLPTTVRPELRIIANRPDSGLKEEYDRKLLEAQHEHHLRDDDPVLFLEVRPGDASDFSNQLAVQGIDIEGHRVLRTSSPAIPNAIAGLLLDLRDRTGCLPHAYFGWTEGNPIIYLMKFLAFGEGDTAPVCREVLRQAEHVPERRPRVHVG
jgi:hypothetical protein